MAELLPPSAADPVWGKIVDVREDESKKLRQ
jgi:hypothetical protein